MWKKISIKRSLIPVCVVVALLIMFGGSKVIADATDIYQLDFGPLIEAIPGEQGLLIPMDIHVTEPTVAINILLVFDASLITPDIIAPNIFFQSFEVDQSYPGRIKMNLRTDLAPPPVIPPLLGDTTYAWISVTVTSEHIGYDLLTHIDFFEDPVTPYPDNNILLEAGGWVVPPNLVLEQADILIINPIYGDINVNGYPYEIGDAITFMNYFMGEVEFTKRQYANSDCNQDGIQATIADLVYLLSVISGDTLMYHNPPYADTQQPLISLDRNEINHVNDNYTVCDIGVSSEQSLGGAYFVLNFDPGLSEPISVNLNPGCENMDLSWAVKDDELMIALYDWQGREMNFPAGEVVSVAFSESAADVSDEIYLSHAEFSDEGGNVVDGDATLSFRTIDKETIPKFIGVKMEGYPNPFNASISLNYYLPVDGNYDLVIFDLLGREIRTLFVGDQTSGPGNVVWNGVDNYGSEVASGLYFARLRGEQVSASLKLIMMK